MQTLTVTLEDGLYRTLQKIARQLDKTPEEVSAEWIAIAVERMEDDPLLALAGTLECNVPDVGERHDYYIGQALLRELRDDEEA